jgi:hypothetical protein
MAVGDYIPEGFWDNEFEGVDNLPRAEIWLKHLRAKPFSNKKLKLIIRDDSKHASIWAILQKHANRSNVVLSLGSGQQYGYYCVSEEDGFFLYPLDDVDKSVYPDEELFCQQGFHLKIPY